MATKKYWWTPILNFFVHACVGTVVFVVVGTPAVGLSFFVHFLETLGVPEFTIDVLTFLEHVILMVDVAAVIVYISVATYREIKEMLNE